MVEMGILDLEVNCWPSDSDGVGECDGSQIVCDRAGPVMVMENVMGHIMYVAGLGQ